MCRFYLWSKLGSVQFKKTSTYHLRIKELGKREEGQSEGCGLSVSDRDE